MKNITFLSLFLLAFAPCIGQSTCCPYMDSIQIIPSMPGPTDSIRIITKTTCPGLGNKVSYQYIISNDTIFLTGCFFSGPLAAIQEYVDTTNIGILPGGNYTIAYTAYLSSNQTDCLIKVDSNAVSTNFMVLGPNAIEQTDQETQFILYPNPSKNNIRLSAPYDLFTVFIHDLAGRKIFEEHCHREVTINLSHVDKGIYSVTVEEGKNKRTQTILIE